VQQLGGFGKALEARHRHQRPELSKRDIHNAMISINKKTAIVL
jgi:hypothetical protein